MLARLAGGFALLTGLLAVSASWAQGCRSDTLRIRGDFGQARFSVEVADSEEERALGLMFRQSLPGSAGMLFIYPKPQTVAFWMRNTLIPLDMIFLDASGGVRHVHHRAVPGDETPVPGGDDILAVLEINGGLARGLGIAVGHQVQHPAFAQNAALWPCE